jgi:hypothetical protein
MNTDRVIFGGERIIYLTQCNDCKATNQHLENYYVDKTSSYRNAFRL